MTKMDIMPVYAEKDLKFFISGPEGLMTLVCSIGDWLYVGY